MDEESSEAELHAKTGEERMELKEEGNVYYSDETCREIKNESDVCVNAFDNISIKVERETDSQDECSIFEETTDDKTNESYSDVQMADEEDICTSEISSVYIKTENDDDINDKWTFSEETNTIDDKINDNDFDLDLKHDNNAWVTDENAVFIKHEDIKDEISVYEESFGDEATEKESYIYDDGQETTTKAPLSQTPHVAEASTNSDGVIQMKVFRCEICNTEFSMKDTLRKHMKQHLHEKLFRCKMSSKEFAVKDSLVQHMRVHTNKNLYKREMCSKEFSDRDSLIAHLRPLASRHNSPACIQHHKVMDHRQHLKLLYLLYLRKNKRQCRVHWIHPINEQRDKLGAFAMLYKELRSNGVKFFNYFSMSMDTFDELLQCLHPCLKHENTKMRDAIPPVERLAVTIRYLVSGSTITDLHYAFRMGKSTISGIVNSVCQTIWAVLQEKCIPKPSLQQLQKTAQGFKTKANFPHCIGAVGGKRMKTIKPQGSGSMHLNYKDCFSIMLMVVADSEYRFTFVDIRCVGSDCDSSIFKHTSFWKSIDENELPFPKPKPLPGIEHPCVPYVLLGDEAFSLHTNLMRPFSGRQLSITKRVFNYRLNRTRRCVEHAFSLLSSKWKIFHRPLNVSQELAMNVIKACCVLHNFVLERDGYNFEETLTITGLDDVPRALSVRSGASANDIRNTFADYFMSEHGSLSWQSSKI
ncbi:uncharacterized protein LOC122264324 isoform X2 [Penaeus japonicus]|uniref:uncharacterized protein LOC122264324 isoform X2 n=1 Tax=Penaeus japonicus TaxID=27405 RepID=UPI001C710EF1|nr:uncharacterized protein LOC122264324 isoform X2 [Penaeus japonicus]